MLYYFFVYVLRPHFSPLNVFRYITVRTAVASLTALLLSLLLGPWVIDRLRDLQVKQYIREEGPKGHQKKAGTPTMGGVLIVASMIIPTLLWADLRNAYVLLAMGATVAFGAIGFIDDYNKVVRKRNMGLTPRAKFSLQVLTCVIVGIVLLVLQTHGAYSTQVSVPFFKRLHPDLVIDSLLGVKYVWALAYVPLVLFLVLVIVGCSNAVNLTDGLDGLAIGCVLVSAVALTVLDLSLQQRTIRRLSRDSENSRCRRNRHLLRFSRRRVARFPLVQRPSRRNVYGRRGLARARRRHRHGSRDHQAGNSCCFRSAEFSSSKLLSVIIQVGSFKLTGKRIFRMAPLHHHFELMGWSESKIIVRFWIVALVFALFSLTTLKLR